jgi:hypothetical protein
MAHRSDSTEGGQIVRRSRRTGRHQPLMGDRQVVDFGYAHWTTSRLVNGDAEVARMIRKSGHRFSEGIMRKQLAFRQLVSQFRDHNPVFRARQGGGPEPPVKKARSPRRLHFLSYLFQWFSHESTLDLPGFGTGQQRTFAGITLPQRGIKPQRVKRNGI